MPNICGKMGKTGELTMSEHMKVALGITAIIAVILLFIDPLTLKAIGFTLCLIAAAGCFFACFRYEGTAFSALAVVGVVVFSIFASLILKSIANEVFWVKMAIVIVLGSLSLIGEGWILFIAGRGVYRFFKTSNKPINP